jgi:hypothetical protein
MHLGGVLGDPQHLPAVQHDQPGRHDTQD